MNSPPKKKRAPAKSALQEYASSVYEQDKQAQERFLREAHRLARESFKTGGEKHFRAFRRHMDGMRDWQGKGANA